MKVLVKPRPRWRPLHAAQYGLAAVGILALSYCVGEMVKAKLFQSTESAKFKVAIESSPSERSTVLIRPPHDGAVLGQLSIPSLKLDVMVVEGVEEDYLRHAVGRIPGTALPGEKGNMGIAGHRDTFFRPLRLIHLGDTITLRTLAAFYRYRVVATKVVEPEDVQVLDPGANDGLTLVTCFPFYYLGPAPKRFIIKAERLPGV
jgi:sortase A